MSSMTVERDLPVPMRDGVRLFANLYRPATDGAYPVIMSVTPYGKDKLQDRIANGPASQLWSIGRVGLIGVSYLCMSQRYVAALKPPHLRAVVPWEGVTDLYRKLAFHGGIPETKFVHLWAKKRIERGRNRKFPLAEDFLAERKTHPLDDSYWASKRPILENIEVPALICANWSWPPELVQPARLYLRADTGSLQESASSESKVQYQSTSPHGRAVFSYRFKQPAELMGGMRLKLWVSTSEGDDLDLFVVLRKLDSTGTEVFSSGFNGYERDSVAKGWLRASHRALDPSRSTALRPWYSHPHVQKLRPGDIVPLEIEIWPSATLFEAGSTLQLTIQGHDAANYPAFGHRDLVNRGSHTIFTGGPYDSCLTVPLNQSGLIEVPLASS